MLDRLALPALPVLRGEHVVLRDLAAADVDDRLRHPILMGLLRSEYAVQRDASDSAVQRDAPDSSGSA
jgi:hypothetical protein